MDITIFEQKHLKQQLKIIKLQLMSVLIKTAYTFKMLVKNELLHVDLMFVKMLISGSQMRPEDCYE